MVSLKDSGGNHNDDDPSGNHNNGAQKYRDFNALQRITLLHSLVKVDQTTKNSGIDWSTDLLYVYS
jgi:hypothetical protein